MIRRLLPLAAALLATAVPCAPAAAHTGEEGRGPVLERVVPAVDGLDVEVLPDGFAKLRLTTAGSTTAAVLDRTGRPFVRVGPDGVMADAANPEWYVANEPLGIARPGDGAAAGAPARWKRVSAGRAWEWFDHRLHPASGAVDRWAVPLDVGGRRVTVRGRVVDGARVAVPRLTRDPAARARASVIGKPTAALQIDLGDAERIDVTGPEGEPFARLRAGGVQVNVHSPAWVPTAQHRNRDLLAAVIDADAEPEWVTLGPETNLIWPDPRLFARNWAVPVRVDGRASRLVGTTEYVVDRHDDASPASTAGIGSGGGTDWGLIGGVVVASVALLGGAALVVRSRA